VSAAKNLSKLKLKQNHDAGCAHKEIPFYHREEVEAQVSARVGQR
jgi:hypothetical protein